MHFGLRPARAGDVGVSEINGTQLRFDDMIVPLMTVLPMGFSHALRWARQSHVNILQRSGSLDASNFMVDFRPPQMFLAM